MDRSLSRHWPVVDRTSDHVVAWLVRVTLSEPSGATAFDDIEVKVPDSVGKPARDWCREEVDKLVALTLDQIDVAGIAPSPARNHYNRLVDILQHRARFAVDENFTFEEPET